MAGEEAQLRLDGSEVPLSEVDSGPERETDPCRLAVKREIQRLAELRRLDREERE